MNCAYCGCEIGIDNGPPDGRQLENSMTVCHACRVNDTARIVNVMLAINERLKSVEEWIEHEDTKALEASEYD